MSDSLNYLDDMFILNIDDINDENDKTSRKTSSLWTYVDCKNPAHPGVPVCKRCNFVFSVKSSNTTLERHLLNKYNITIPKHFLLDIISFKTRHTGINMATEITKVLHEFKLVGKAMAITTDNESAMLVCGRKLAEEFEREIDDLSFNHYRCSAHILNFAIKQGMEIIDNKEILDV
ncbi:hypothetical protein RclHR1_03850001 [Rhizophagus clarus]|uniref:BED-type domain-containing protein n=1 Tax=Rhizophagus clarus TaxID=94130 RepID=A0A2Z6RH56_9GLOM|nr:hypothetical protein RclHR1_03850001 [Rhizophagus clarus]